MRWLIDQRVTEFCPLACLLPQWTQQGNIHKNTPKYRENLQRRPHPNSSKQIDQFLRYELVECGAGVKYLENIPLSLSLWLSILDMASSEKISMLGRRALFSRWNQSVYSRTQVFKNYSKFDQLIVHASHIAQQVREEVQRSESMMLSITNLKRTIDTFGKSSKQVQSRILFDLVSKLIQQN